MKTLSEMIAVMQGAKEGKVIETRKLDSILPWSHFLNPLWNWQDYDYRVKPVEPVEPRKCWVLNIAGISYAYQMKPADIWGSPPVEFIELTPEIRKKLRL
jgi:hypothetical protein